MKRLAAAIGLCMAAAAAQGLPAADAGVPGPAARAAQGPTALFLAPYKDITRGLGRGEPLIAEAGAPSTWIWAFATGECGDERWGEGIDTEAFARANVARAQLTGRRYLVSTGGALGSFGCASAQGLARFLARYDSPLLAGFDFDIEGTQTPEQIRSLVAQLAVLARQRPALRLSFTLATHAGHDAARRGLNATGLAVLAALREHGLDRAIINLMVMNYGEPSARWCVPRRGPGGPACDMGRSALQAAHNLHQRHGWPYARIALTAMLGENDVARNRFTLADARRLMHGARRLGIDGVHFWSLDRDRPCPPGEPRVSPACHALAEIAPGAFSEIFLRPAGHAKP